MADIKKFTPVLRPQQSVKLQIPHTPEGREFVERLKALLGTKELPFVQTCPPTKQPTVGASEDSGSTTYSLDIRMEQEGWPP